MAKKKLVVSLKPIKEQIQKAEKNLRKIKPKVSVADRKQIDLDIKNLNAALATVREICKNGIMTHGFDPAGK
jgi:spermidine/putrescine-binding protein